MLERKLKLFTELENNIFKEFTPEEDLIIHSKHGEIDINGRCGIIYAFKAGLDLIIYVNHGDNIIEDYNYGKVTNIDWNNYIVTTDMGSYSFKFKPINLYEL